MPSDPAAGPKTGFCCFPAWVPWMVLAAALLAIAWATLQWMTWRTELVTLRTELRLAELSLMDAQQRREADHILWQHQLAAPPQPSAAPAPSADSSVDSSQNQLDSASPEIVLLASPHAGSPSAVGAVIWNPATQAGVFTAQNLPPPATGQVYRLWAVDPQYAHPIAAGVIDFNPQTGSARGPFKPGRSLPATVKFRVSLERQDSSTAPDGPIVLASP
jgi:hypothetical protein